VTPDVLIPRPETELLVEAAINLLNESVVSPLICDVGTGSGCIVIALLRVRHDAKALAIDISEAAIRVAHVNAHRLGVHERIDFIVSDGFSSLTPRTQGFDLVVSNPPYVSLSALQGLQREVRDYEPLVALKGGVDGLSIIRNLLKESSRYLKPGGCFLFEIGFDQGDAVREMVDMNVWDILDIHPDLQGIPRIVALRRERLKQP
jgi:release factor glutamine methyltransferase